MSGFAGMTRRGNIHLLTTSVFLCGPRTLPRINAPSRHPLPAPFHTSNTGFPAASLLVLLPVFLPSCLPPYPLSPCPPAASPCQF